MGDQAAECLDDESDPTLDFVNDVRLRRVESSRHPQLCQRFLSGPPGILQKPTKLWDRTPAAGLGYVRAHGERRPNELIRPRRGSRSR